MRGAFKLSSHTGLTMIQARVENVATTRPTRSTVVGSNWYCIGVFTLLVQGLESWTVASAANFSVSYGGYCRANCTVQYYPSRSGTVTG